MSRRIEAVIVMGDIPPEPPLFRDRGWYAEFRAGQETKRLRVDQRDSWNLDIYVGLPVAISVRDARWCHILSRMRDRKKFVRSG